MAFELLVPAGLSPVSGSGSGPRTFEGHATTGLRDAPGPPRRVRCNEDDVVRIEWADGLQVAVRASDLQERQRRDRGSADGPVALPTRDTARGVIVDAIVRLVVGAVAPAAAQELARRIDGHLAPAPGWCSASPKHAAAEPPRKGRWLVLLHGTFSNTRGAFSDLLLSDDWSALGRERREGDTDRVLGFEHYTLTRDPLENASALVDGVRDVELDLVSHSRGGLVGDVLAAACHPGAVERAKAATRLPSTHGELARLRESFATLAVACRKQKVRVRHHVRVGCPARGTTLASSRLDTWLNVLVNVLGLVPGFRTSGLYGPVTDFVTAVVAERSDPASIPGLWSMIPEAPFVRWLASLRSEDRLTVLAGTSSRDTWLRQFTTLLAELYFGRDSDLVVDTHAMSGGVARTGLPGRIFSFRDGDSGGVHHLGYFGHTAVRSRICGRLRLDPGAPEPPDADRGAATVPEPVTGRVLVSSTPTGQRPVVVLIPDTMGSVLSDADGEIWPVVSELAESGLRRLAAGAEDVTTAGVLAMPFRLLVRHLTGAFDVVPFAWDWRCSVRPAADVLRDKIESLLGSSAQPVHLLAHGAGGLVARGLLAWHLGVWKNLTARGGRLVMLGTPNHGAHRTVRLLTGDDPLVRMLATIDLGAGTKEAVSATLRSFAGLLETLPVSPDTDPGSAPIFETTHWPPDVAPAGPALVAAARVRQDLAAAQASDADAMRYVAGQSATTPCNEPLEERDDAATGDGVLLWSHGRLPGVPTYLGRAVHGALASSPHLFGAISDLLGTGETRVIGELADRPVTGKPRELPSASRHPDEDDLVRAALAATDDTQMWTLEIAVRHGDLGLESGVVLVGHLAGDRLRGAESSLDLALGGALSDRLKARRYPQAVGNVVVVPTQNRTTDEVAKLPKVAIVVGLGPDERLSRTLVAEAVAAGVADSARPPNSDLVPAGPSGVTLGVALPDYGLRGLTLDEAVNGIIEGVVTANRELARLGLGARRVGLLRMLVPYGDHAAEALRIARRWLVSPGIGLELDEELGVAPICEPQYSGGEGDDIALAPQRPIRMSQPVRYRRISARAERVGPRGPEMVSYSVPSDDSSGWLAEQDVTWRTLVEATVALTERNEFSRTRLVQIRDHSLPLKVATHFDAGFDLQLAVDRWTAAIPWEAFLSEGVDATAVLSGRISILRQYESERERSDRPTVDNGAALLVCAPGPEDQRLDAVEREITEVRRRLQESQFKVQVVGDADARLVREHLCGRYEIAHLAGHGVYTERKPDRTGLLTATGEVIGRRDLRHFEREPPALVFLNCCHLGRVDQLGNCALAADLATYLVDIGVRAVVAAGWAVRDAGAEAFARELYATLLSGQSFRNAVAQARLAARQAAPDAPTWAAYQCYGDPDFVLPSAVGSRESVDAELLVHLSRVEIVTALEAEDALGQVLGRLALTPHDKVAHRRLADAALRFYERLPSALRSRVGDARMARLLAGHPDEPKRERRRDYDGTKAATTDTSVGVTTDLDALEAIVLRFAPAPAPASEATLIVSGIRVAFEALLTDWGVEVDDRDFGHLRGLE